eukprot:Em0009g822a
MRLVLFFGVVLLVVSYLLQRPTRFSFTLAVTINHVDPEAVVHFVSTPALITSVHANPSVVTSEERDAEGRIVGTIEDTVVLSVFGLFDLPPTKMTVPFVLTARGNEVHYYSTMPYITISQTYSVATGGEGVVQLSNEFNGTCAWILSFIAEKEARESHVTMLTNAKNALERNNKQ